MVARLAVATLTIAAVLAVAGTADAKRSAKDQALFEKARKDCSSTKRANSAWPYINYKGGWYRCVESKSGRN